MLERSLAALGIYLKNVFEIDNIKYCEKSAIFKKLSEDHHSLKIPAISYYDSTISYSTGKGYSTILKYNSNFTKATTASLDQVKLNISIGLVTKNLKQHFDFAKKYFSLKHNAVFEASFVEDGEEQVIEISMDTFSELSSPPEGKEGYDYDKSIYYVREGSFNINTMVLFSKERELIRRINLEVTV